MTAPLPPPCGAPCRRRIARSSTARIRPPLPSGLVVAARIRHYRVGRALRYADGESHSDRPAPAPLRRVALIASVANAR